MIRLTAVIEMEGQEPRALTHESNARTILLGRDDSADFKLPLATISRHHARVSQADNVYVIEDLGSTHGTLVNGKPMLKNEKRVLRDGDVIDITRAKITCTIAANQVASMDPGEDTQAMAVKAVQGILGRLGEAQSEGPFIRIISGADEGKRFPLSGNLSEWSFGRSRECECVLNDPNVSRRHALIKKDWNGFIIQDLGSRNGILINDRLIRKPRRLADKDEITIGPMRLIFIDPDAELLASLKDVPGFEAMDAALGDDDGFVEDADPDASHVGAPEGIEEIADSFPPEEEPRPTDVLPGVESPEAGDDEFGNIDPDLLAGGSTKRFPVEWVWVGLGLVLVAAGIAGLLYLFNN